MSDDDKRLTSSDFSPEILSLFDKYVHNVIDRRAFLDEAAKVAAAGVTATAILEALRPKFAEAQQIAKTDARVHAETIEFAFPAGHGRGRGYLVKPAKAAGKLPAVLVVHENRGLNPHIEDVARRLALEGFLAFAPDALFPLGGYPGDEDKARELFAKLETPKTQQDFVAAYGTLKARPESNGKVGVVGFCWGGGISHFLATRLPDLKAAVPFYGMPAELDHAANVRAPLLIHFAENDDRINAAWPPYKAALEAAKVKFEAFTYPGTQHGFHNDTTPRYDAAAAKLAWKRTVDFLRTHTAG